MAHLITETDSAFYGRNLSAWHNLGIVKGEVTLSDLHGAFSWPVSTEQLFTIQGEATSTYATIRTLDNGKRVILGDKLSSAYSVLQNFDLIEAVAPFVEAGCMIESGLSMSEGRKIVICLRLQGDLVAGKDDHIARYIMVSNDHTGGEAARIGFTPVRVVCANTLAMAHGDSASQLIRLHHKGDIKGSLEAVTRLIDSANGQFLAYGDQLERLMARYINTKDLRAYVKEVFMPDFVSEADLKDTASSAAREKARKEADRLLKLQNAIEDIFEANPTVARQADSAGTWYGAYQAVNYHLNHGTGISDAEKRLQSVAFGTYRQTDSRALKSALVAVS